MTYSEMIAWLETCPDHHWEIVHLDEGHARVLLCFEPDEDEDNE